MIIQSARLSTGTDLPKLTGHVFAGAANDAITVLHGVQDDLDGMQQDAAAAKKPYAIRHFKIAPAETTDRVEAADVMRDLAREFGFALAHCVIVEHAKPRQPGGYEYHWHLLVPEWDPARRRVLDNKWTRPRQEKIARRAEARLGHALVTGRWNAAVARRLEAEGQSDLAAAMAALAARPRPTGAYSAGQHQAVARKGVDLPTYVTLIREAWNTAQDGQEFEAEIEKRGVILQAGDNAGVWLAYAHAGGQDVKLGALHRLLRVPRVQVHAVISAEHKAPAAAM